jgi:hypothetical protein
MAASNGLIAASDLWKLLRGLLCVHKPSGVVLDDLVRDVNKILLKDLNEFQPERADLTDNKNIQQNGGLIDYSNHPLVLGDRFHDDDLEFEEVNQLNIWTSGLSLITVNDSEIQEKIKNLVLPRQYLLKAELGIATDNSYKSGKVVEKSTFEHLISRPQILDKALAGIRSSHQRDAFRQAGVNLQSQEAYELAVQGLVRPQAEHEGYPLIYGLNCVNFRPPFLTLAVTCMNETPQYLSEFVAELGLRLRTNAVCTHLQLVRFGPFTSKNSLLLKHLNISSAIENTFALSEILDNVEHQKFNLG